MNAYHGKPEIKEKYLKRVEAHRAADDLIRGTYWELDETRGEYRGCAVGCTVHSADHDAYETELGIPTAIAYLEDRIFEGLPLGSAMAWPTRFLMAIPVGADLSGVVDRLMLWLLAPDGYNLAQYTARDDGKRAIARVHALYARKVVGDAPTKQEWDAAYNAAHAAAAHAAYATADYAYAAARAAHAAAAYAAHADADADAHAYAYAAHAAAYANAAAYAAYAAAYEQIAEYLLRLLAGAPVVAEVLDGATLPARALEQGQSYARFKPGDIVRTIGINNKHESVVLRYRVQHYSAAADFITLHRIRRDGERDRRERGFSGSAGDTYALEF